MADYTDIQVTSEAWTALPVATEDHTLTVTGGPIWVTDHSNPGTLTNGHFLGCDKACRVLNGKTAQVRLASNVGATIARSTLA